MFSYAQFMKVHQIFQKKNNVYSQDPPITPEAGKKGSFFEGIKIHVDRHANFTHANSHTSKFLLDLNVKFKI